MKVLVIGGGGREHTLVWKIARSPLVDKIFCIPGNGGIENIAECRRLAVSDFRALATFVKEQKIDFTVIGPEQPLVTGIVDFFESQGFPVFGPRKSGARLEGSKIFAKRLMAKYDIPTAGFAEFSSYHQATDYIKGLAEQPLVVKADGLAAGKGSIVCPDRKSALEAVDSLMKKRIFKEAGAQIVIEEFMTGEEVSIFVITDGKDYLTLSPAQDFKRALDNDQGKNTGGMGSYAPTPFLTEALRQKAVQKIIEPTLDALATEGIDYRGVLYCGLMLTPGGPRVVEFNCRFGDPETQVVLPLLETDLMEILQAAVHREIGTVSIELKSQFATCVVLASGGYPDAYETGKTITGLGTLPEDVLSFHAGTRRQDSQLVTAGGRVLGITALADNLRESAGKSYQAVEKIHFENMHFRRDISKRAWHLTDG